jgi:Kef-type K+ transport system membrane component KefB
MASALNPEIVTHGIQLALAPVFLLTAVAGMIAAVSGRLARVIDRARKLEDQLRTTQDEAFIARALKELGELRMRGRIVNASVALLTLCALLIGLTVIVLFIGETTDYASARLPLIFFMAGVVCFLMALLAFLVDTFMATRLLNFEMLKK